MFKSRLTFAQLQTEVMLDVDMAMYFVMFCALWPVTSLWSFMQEY